MAIAVAGGPARHIPVLARPALELLQRARRRHLYRRHLRRRRLYAARSSRPPMRRSSASTATRARSRDGVGPGRSGRRAADAGRGPLLRRSIASREKFGHAAVDGVVLDLGVSSMQLDEAERGFSFRLDGPLDMRMGGDGPERRRCGGAGLRARSRRHHLPARRGAAFARRRARHRRRAQAGADRDHRRARRHRRRASCARKPDQIHPATRTFQALRIFVNEELAELAAALVGRRAHPQARRAAGGGDLPFARGPHRQDVPRRAQPHRRRVAPSAGSRGAGRRPSASSPSARSRRTRPRSPPIRARARPSCAPPSAPTRRRARSAIWPICCRGCRRSPTS